MTKTAKEALRKVVSGLVHLEAWIGKPNVVIQLTSAVDGHLYTTKALATWDGMGEYLFHAGWDIAYKRALRAIARRVKDDSARNRSHTTGEE